MLHDRLMYVVTKIMPVVCIVGASHLTLRNTLFPSTGEKQAALQQLRQKRYTSKFAKPPPGEQQTSPSEPTFQPKRMSTAEDTSASQRSATVD
ncbi:hypothetical protein BWQ96_03541 [Gracilariopsis chorda]|uniref:Uncharacterized protein n=1 Tax=Gracilariopsis chorda TaxID=448386 RepID=A0A2V3IXC1_9FLOR|nr:hypothetical protein BWQ96_03541 [Gracilariopsis chorda]|eukprot:PXF46715.1 hypothetical protein BWQ96_03541 [Gracilariopsis chorda]